MYLVVLQHTMDDLPLALFTSQEKAERFAADVDPMPTDEIRRIYNTDCATPVQVSIVCFNERGQPYNRQLVRLFDEP